MATAGAEALYAQLHEGAPFHDGTFKSWAQKRSRTHPYHFSDGVTIWVAEEDLTPDDDFLSIQGVNDGWDDEDDTAPAHPNR